MNMISNQSRKKIRVRIMATVLGIAMAGVVSASNNPFERGVEANALQLAGMHGKKMEMIDTDGDGAVSKDEFMKAHEKKFEMKDANGDGMLTEEEMKKGGKCHHGKSDGHHKGHNEEE